MRNIYDLPPDLPVPQDDGGCDHLPNQKIPSIDLVSTNGNLNVAQIFSEPSVLFIYPRAGSPLEPSPNEELWDLTPGARGCTPQSCAFRDAYSDFQSLGVQVYGMSMQSPKVQKEFVERNHIPFPILSDSKYQFTDALKLPTFAFEGERLIKRMALYIENRAIKKVFYPVFPSNQNAREVLSWLQKPR